MAILIMSVSYNGRDRLKVDAGDISILFAIGSHARVIYPFIIITSSGHLRTSRIVPIRPEIVKISG